MGRSIRRAALSATLSAALAACTSSPISVAPPTRPRPAPSPPTTATLTSPRPAPSREAAPTAVGRPNCHPPSDVGRLSGVPELHGAGDGIQMWGIVMAAKPFAALRVHEDVKIVWRVTGRGPLRLSSIDPSGRKHRLQWGPYPHLSSNYERPGQEWGAGYRFGVPGCWTLRAVRGHSSADAWVTVTG